MRHPSWHAAGAPLEMSADPQRAILEVRALEKHFAVSGSAPWSRRRGTLRAVDGISFDLLPQRTFSIVGESGCGKTTTAKVALGLEPETGGEVLFRGAPLRQLRGGERRTFRRSVQAVFQDPTSALNPRRRVGQIVAEPLVVNEKLSQSERRARVDELLEAVGLEAAVASSFPHQLSGGMRQRVAVAQAIALTPDVVVLDEPVSALDVSIRAQIMNLLKDLQHEQGISYLLIAHDLATVRYLSHEVASMYLGQFVERALVDAFFSRPLHPYSVALVSAVGSTALAEPRERIVLHGDVGSAASPPSGCRFHPRCWLRSALGSPDRCSTERPGLRQLADDHVVACHFAEELLDVDRRQGVLAAAKREGRLDVGAEGSLLPGATPAQEAGDPPHTESRRTGVV